MCGITGIARPTGDRVDPDVLHGMMDAVRHRGPDDEGTVLLGSMALGFRRLSIIDLVSGHQPMASEDRSVWVILNGEIYNFAELRLQLEASGHVFATKSDTECIVHGYEQWGEAVAGRLSGMFALAVLDVKANRIFCARDRMGKKPFYYARLIDGGFAFASELKGLLRCPGWNKTMSRGSLAKYLCFEFVPDPFTIFEGAAKLPPGHTLSYSCDSGKLRVERYFDITFDRAGCGGRKRPEEDVREEFLSTIDAAVKKRLVADVPLGIFLSGGIDSSVITCMMARHVDPSKIRTFTIGFKDPSFDESRHARAVAGFFGTDHHEDILEPESLVELLPDVAEIIDEPLGDASIIPTYLLSRFSRKYVTVTLGGDGGDELFAGYPTFFADRAARAADMLPPGAARALAALSQARPTSLANISPDFIVKQFSRGLSYRGEHRHQAWLGSFLPHEADELLGERLNPYGIISETMEEPSLALASAQDRLLYFYCKFYLAGDILVKTDRASMAVSLECRAPFLDADVVRFASALDPGLRLRGITSKYIVKKSMEGMLPFSILRRPKKGFGIPVGKWLKGPLKPWLLEELSFEKIEKEGIFNPTVVTRIVNQHLSGKFDRRKQLWTLLVFEKWLAKHGQQ
ncbi:MAG: asparagine synthase (glutamine-hydrolyzing) [Pseudomonadota bacterium]